MLRLDQLDVAASAFDPDGRAPSTEPKSQVSTPWVPPRERGFPPASRKSDLIWPSGVAIPRVARGSAADVRAPASDGAADRGKFARIARLDLLLREPRVADRVDEFHRRGDAASSDQLRALIALVFSAHCRSYSEHCARTRTAGAKSPPVEIAVRGYFFSNRDEFDLYGLEASVARLFQGGPDDADAAALIVPIAQMLALIEVHDWLLMPPSASQSHRARRGVQYALRVIAATLAFDADSLIARLLDFEGILARDPAGVYGAMDDASRAHYRRAASDLARLHRCSGRAVAAAAIELALSAAATSSVVPADVAAHVGFYLVDDGRPILQQRLSGAGGHRDATSALIPRAVPVACVVRRHATSAWAATLFVTAALASSWHPGAGAFAAVGMMILLALVASDLVAGVREKLACMKGNQRFVSALDFRDGVPEERSCAICMPSLLVDEAQLAAVIDGLEAIRRTVDDPNVRFVLLTDFVDSAEQEPTAEETALLREGKRRIAALNRRHGSARYRPFHLLHRQRRYCATQRAWIGEERKRGKLDAFNRLLKNLGNEFEASAEEVAELRNVRYVLVLDDDSRLAPGGLQHLIGVMAHPLNRPVLDQHRRCVVRGHGMLVPDWAIRADAVARWRLGEAIAGPRADDSHDTPAACRAVVEWHRQRVVVMGASSPQRARSHVRASLHRADARFELFGERVYNGKCLYDVDAFAQLLEARLPAQQVLSHDTLEGAWLRPGYVCETALTEGFPSTYANYCERLHRWCRGDWQNVFILLGRVRRFIAHRQPTDIPALCLFVVAGQARRSLAAVAASALMIWAVFAAPDAAASMKYLLTLSALALAPSLFSLAADLCVDWRCARLRYAATAYGLRLKQLLGAEVFRVVFAPHQMIVALDAIARTAVRMVTRRNLLQWTSSASIEAGRRSPSPTRAQLWFVSLATLGMTVLCWPASVAATAVAVAWIAGPALASLMSRNLERSDAA